MAQGVGSVLGGPVAAMLHQSTGSWIPVFAVIITMDFTTAALAIAALKPMRRRWLEKSRSQASQRDRKEPLGRLSHQLVELCQNRQMKPGGW